METATIKRKIEVLTAAADAVSSGTVRYVWKRTYSCNCGIVAQKALDTDWKGLKLRLAGYNPSYATWEWLLGERDKIEQCGITNLPVKTVFAALDDAGFSSSELLKLELLSDAKILREAGLETDSVARVVQAANSARFVTYLRAWVRILQRELKKPRKRKKARQ